MKKELSQQAVIGIVAATVVLVGIIGWMVLKPSDDGVAKPHVQKLGGGAQNRLQMMQSAVGKPPGGGQ
jgi:hypothetical protein